MSITVDETIRTKGERINRSDHRPAPVMLPLHTPHQSRRILRAQPAVIAYAGFVPSYERSAKSNPEV